MTMKRSTWWLELPGLLLPPVMLIYVALTGLEPVALLTLLASFAGNVFMLYAFERTRPQAGDLVPIVVLAAIATAGRLLFAPFASFKPMAAVAIVAGLSFGRLSGYATGALAMFISNLFFGQGPWTPWQMFAFGLAGWFAGFVPLPDREKRRVLVPVLGFFFAFLSGFMLDLWYVVGFVSPLTWPAVITAFLSGFYFNLSGAVATVVFLIPIQAPWVQALQRIQRKYGLRSPKS